jgi:hypothetical protein
MRAQHSNSQSCELRGVLELGPSRRSLEEALTRREPYPYRHLGYQRFVKEESRVFDSRTHDRESRRALALRPWLWSQGDVRLAPGVKLRRAGFSRRTCGSDSRGSNRNLREPLRLEENLERSCADLGFTILNHSIGLDFIFIFISTKVRYCH